MKGRKSAAPVREASGRAASGCHERDTVGKAQGQSLRLGKLSLAQRGRLLASHIGTSTRSQLWSAGPYPAAKRQ